MEIPEEEQQNITPEESLKEGIGKAGRYGADKVKEKGAEHLKDKLGKKAAEKTGEKAAEKAAEKTAEKGAEAAAGAATGGVGTVAVKAGELATKAASKALEKLGISKKKQGLCCGFCGAIPIILVVSMFAFSFFGVFLGTGSGTEGPLKPTYWESGESPPPPPPPPGDGGDGPIVAPVKGGHAFPLDRTNPAYRGYWDSFGAERRGTGSGVPHRHAGTDIMHLKDIWVNEYAVVDGTITRLRSRTGGYSFWIVAIPTPENGYDTLAYYYTHVHDVLVSNGDTVLAGQLIAHSGGYNGGAKGDHLHFGVGSSTSADMELPWGVSIRPGDGTRFWVNSDGEITYNPYYFLKTWE